LQAFLPQCLVNLPIKSALPIRAGMGFYLSAALFPANRLVLPKAALPKAALPAALPQRDGFLLTLTGSTAHVPAH
jgi:hypothetical protein